MAQQNSSHIPLSAQSNNYLLELDNRGRIVLPKALRNRLHLQPGEKLLSSIEGNTLQIISAKAQLAKVQGLLASISPERCLSGELITERRQEAKGE